MSGRGPSGRRTPRWSLRKPTSAAALTAGLVLLGEWVSVGPPLLASGLRRAAVRCLSPPAVRPQDASLAMLLPLEVGGKPAHSVPGASARIVFCKESSEPD